MTHLKAYVVSDSDDNIRVVNMTELEALAYLKTYVVSDSDDSIRIVNMTELETLAPNKIGLIA
jgi:hypothetical protein